MQMAVDVAGFTPAEADQLRRAMGSKRSTERMERLRDRFYAGMAANGITGELADKIFDEAAGVRELRLPGEPLDQLRLPGVRQRLVQALLPGRVLRGAAQRPADGLLLPAVAGRRRPPARRAGARPGRQPRRGPRPCCSRTRTAPAGRRSGSGCPTVRTIGDEARRADRGGAHARRPVPGHGRPGPPRPADRPAGRGAGHGRRVRLRSGWTGGRRCGRPGRSPRCGRSSCRAPRSASTHRRCRG